MANQRKGTRMARNNKMLLYKKQVELAAFWIREEMAATDRAIRAAVALNNYSSAHGYNEFKRGLEEALKYVNRVIISDVESSQTEEKERGVAL